MLLIVRLVAVEECGATNEDAREASALIMTLRRSTERMWSSTVESSENESVASTINAISLRCREPLHFAAAVRRQIEQSSVSNDKQSLRRSGGGGKDLRAESQLFGYVHPNSISL